MFKKGDRVKISKNCDLNKWIDWERNYGKIGTITNSDGYYRVLFDDGDRSSQFHNNDLELVCLSEIEFYNKYL